MFKYALDLVFRRKLRTFLTSLGILIAVMLMSFILFGMSDLETLIVGQFSEQFKPNELFVSSQDFFGMGGGMMSAPSKENVEEEEKILNDYCIESIEEIDGVTLISPILVINGVDMYLDGDSVAYPMAFPSATNLGGDHHIYKELLQGDDLILNGNEVYVSDFVPQFYEISNEDIIGKTIILKSSPVGTFSLTSKSMVDKEYEFIVAGVVDSANDVMFMNLDKGLEVIMDLGGYDSKEEYIDSVGYYQLLISTEIEKTSDIEESITNDLGLSVISTKTLTNFVSMLTNGLTMALVLFGAISALVASIGIINTMIMSIYEQTKEIGVIKAIGAANWQVLIIFLIQSAIIGLIGGALGLGITYLMMRIADPFIVDLLVDQGFKTDVFFHFRFDYAIYIALGSIVIGIIAGLYPAYRASKLDPVKALRYE